MKKILSCLVLMVVMVAVAGAEIRSQENLSLKAGPTEPGEALSLVWVEAMVFPKVVKEDKVISLGVRTASKVREVRASFDFNSDKSILSSSDGMFWSNTYTIPKGIAAGVHLVRYYISSKKGTIQRTVEFFIESPVGLAENSSNPAQSDVPTLSSWPLTVTSTCAALSGTAVRIIPSGQKLTGISKVAWYKVLFDDGSEGWISSTRVKEPTEDFYNAGYQAYKTGDYAGAIKNYRSAITIDSEFVKGYLWLAKSYFAQGDIDSAADSIAKGLRIDDRDMDCRIMANNLAQKYFTRGHTSYRKAKYQDAIADYRKAVDLKASLTQAWIELGESLSRLGFAAEARGAWKEALKNDPENREIYALLNIDYKPAVAAAKIMPEAVPAMLAGDSISIVKSEKTKKGTDIAKAIQSVIGMTKSLGTPIAEKGWQIKKQGEKFLVSYLCEQSGGALESFDWLVDVDTRQVLPHNDNARLLMSRW